jgi:NAD(P)-dependent dehydrogenase (short-subunit alcohol dehydrogenase family)
MNNKKIALITGGNRGIGFEISRQLAKKGVLVILTARDKKNGKAAAEQLEREHLVVISHPLEVTDQNSINHLVEFVAARYGKLDILVNNAGILINSNNAILTSTEDLSDTLATNLIGPFSMIQSFYMLLKKSEAGKVINISSGMGSLLEMEGTHTAYRISKAALNALTVTTSADFQNTGLKIFSMCPGWVRTRMGGKSAPKSPAEAANTAIWLALENEAQSGKFYRDKRMIDW